MMNNPVLHYGVYKKSVWSESACITSDLTFVHTSFAILFCQKKVKKNCKFTVRVFYKKADMRRDEKHGKQAFLLRWWFIGCGNVDLSSCDETTVTVHTTPNCRKIFCRYVTLHEQIRKSKNLRWTAATTPQTYTVCAYTQTWHPQWQPTAREK